MRQSFQRFYYLPWNVTHIAENVKKLSMDFPNHSSIHPSHLNYFKQLNDLTLESCTEETLCQGINIGF